MELSIVMPCLNEAETLSSCISQAQRFMTEFGINGEVVIADNGSNDGSQEIAFNMGARVIEIPIGGYGAALMGGIQGAQGTYVAIGDADDSYDFASLGPFIESLRNGSDLVMGNRFAGGIGPGAMPWLHRYIGNPILSSIGRLFFRVKIRDFHCGLRAFRRDSILSLNLRTTGMEFASEMVVRAALENLKIVEIPTSLRKDGRTRKPHLRSFRDGWRHLRFLFLYSPNWLFFYPGATFFLIGLIASGVLLNGPVKIGGVGFDIGTLLYATASIIIGYQALLFATLARVYAKGEGLIPVINNRVNSLEEKTSFESGMIPGMVLFLTGLIISVISLFQWRNLGYGDTDPSINVRVIIPGFTGLVLGAQTLMSGFFLGLLRVRTKE
jgi:glycosyltransferase involved in cell wall biosynthesis